LDRRLEKVTENRRPTIPAWYLKLGLLASTGLVCLIAGAAHAQEKEPGNPLAGDPAAIQEGSSLFRANCSPCHGLNAGGGGRGPNLRSGLWVHGGSDAAIFRTISDGVPGTEMPANSFEDSEIWALVAYLRSVSAQTQGAMAGDAAKGESLFFGKSGCVRCHMVKGRGGRLGPELTRVGAARSVAYLTESIREPDKSLSLGMVDPNNHYVYPPEYETVTAVTQDGQRIIGVAKNEDAFTLQLLGQDEKLHLFLKKDLREVIHERRSLMPAYTESFLSTDDLQNLLAYLTGLRGEPK
jgi:putative heme-binding domain-containing protein